MHRPILSLAVSALGLLTLATPVIAQAADAVVVGPEQPGRELGLHPIIEVTGAAASDKLIDPGELTYKDDLRKIRGQVTELSIEWSGPGLPSSVQSLWSSDEYEVPGELGRAKIHAGTFLLRDDLGSWAGPFGGVEYIDGSTDLQATLMGAQGYAGQCAILNVLWSVQRGWVMDGLVFDCHSLQTME